MMPLGRLMSTCELCGMEKVTTRETRTSSTIVDCCNRCLESLGLTPIYDFKNVKTIIPNPNTTAKNSNNRLVGTEEEELISNFHIKIREERETKKWSQEDLARRINERVNLIQKIENGYRVTDSVIKKISKILDIELYSSITPQNERVVKSKENKAMTMGDANITDNTDKPKEKVMKKKMRKLGVTRSGARKKRSE